MTNVNITESDLYFRKVADKPELIEQYIEVKSIVEFRNKITEIVQLLTHYGNNLRIIYDTLNRIKELLITNGSLVGNAGELREQERLENTIRTFTDEIDYIIKNLNHKNRPILTGFKIDSRSVYNVNKNNVVLLKNDTIDIESFIWKATLTDIDSNKYSFNYSKSTIVPETTVDIPNTEYTGTILSTESGSFTLTGFGPQKVNIARNVDITIDLSTAQLLDEISVDSRLEYNFLIGNRDDVYKLRFPRISCRKWKIDTESIRDNRFKFYVDIKNRVLKALDEINAHIETSGTDISVLNIKNDNLLSEYNTKLDVLNLHQVNN